MVSCCRNRRTFLRFTIFCILLLFKFTHTIVQALKWKCHHFDEIFVTGYIESWQNDNVQYSQWCNFHKKTTFLFQRVSVKVPSKQWVNEPHTSTKNCKMTQTNQRTTNSCSCFVGCIVCTRPMCSFNGNDLYSPFPSFSAIFIILSTTVDLLVQAMLIPCHGITCHYRSQMGLWHW